MDDTEFSNFIYQNNHPNLVHILLQMKTRDSIKILRKNRLEEVLFYLIKAGTLSYEEKLDLLTRLSRTHPLSAVAESSLISFLLVPGIYIFEYSLASNFIAQPSYSKWYPIRKKIDLKGLCLIRVMSNLTF